ncbi:MAG: ImmA/IrrE family metallo-endopeptidase [Methanobacteriaceae archaeon]|nr:ImmA/IrrE family metallo-endopeptidase [Methanobacteriaceae archaeon]
MSSAKLQANNDWLVWARKTAYYDIDKIAEEMNVSSDQIIEWENTGKIEYDDLVNLAKHYKRPPMIFFNTNKPAEKEPIQDFRTFDGKKVKITPQISFELRSAEVRRKKLLHLEEESNDYQIPKFALSDINIKDPVEIGYFIRNEIGMNSANMKRRDLNHWIKEVENLGILVFQFYKIEPDDIRGYALYHDKLPIIGINGKEYVNGKKFTLFHELAHIISKKEGLSNFNKYYLENPDEIYCNKIAAEILVPSKILSNLIISSENSTIDDNKINFLSKHFRVSKEVIIRRLLTLKFISKKEYKNKKEVWDAYISRKETRISSSKKPKDLSNDKKESEEKEKSKDPALSYKQKATNVLNKNGSYFTKTIIKAYDDQLISKDDLVEVLGVPLEVVDEIRTRFNEEEF